ncbi:MAG: hypothetical protein I8H75_06075 [Myxococcaceae bacterium]|nr:hypothetical protein [Myxococcaceae bacterium]MBH2006883.1 hypothetical protein [Myxococcaceae bacterium]
MRLGKWTSVLFLVLSVNCAHMKSESLEASAPSTLLWVKKKLFAGVFYDDDRYGMMSPIPLDETSYVHSISGDRIVPPASDETIPFGTRVVLKKIEWPTQRNQVQRPLLTPRQYLWLYFAVAADRGHVRIHRERSYIMVVPIEIRTTSQLDDWLLQYFSKQDNNLEFLLKLSK